MTTPLDLSPAHVVSPFQALQNLMPFRIQDILLVSSLYDSFTLREDGRLNELIVGEFLELSLYHTPGLTHVASGAEAIALATSEGRFDLIISAPEAGLNIPVVVLAYDNAERKEFVARHDLSDIEQLFLWQGNARILVAIVKYVEDRRNVAHDTAVAGVPVILVVEDNVRYYSSFLPEIYTELIMQSQRLISEGMNLSHKLVRMRARPKILLASTFEQAWELFTQYQPYLLGLISDVEFPRGGASSREAGFELARMARAAVPDLPILLQSSRAEFAAGAEAVGATFLQKYSDTLLADLRSFMVERFSLGDFVFRMPDGREVARAADLKSLEALLHTVPIESIAYHGERNHFSNWLIARTEFAVAHKLRPRKVSDFASHEDLRRELINAIAEYRREQSDVLVADFDQATFDPEENFFARIGGGSLGGKARGLAFVRYLLNYHHVERHFPGVQIRVPRAVVLATDCFDRFLEENDLHDLALSNAPDEEIVARFLAADLPADVVDDLACFLRPVKWPLAVRSSSLLEDSQNLPLGGVYQTYMLPNCHPDDDVRLAQLLQAVKRVYASTFGTHVRAQLLSTPFRLEEEKMAVVIQRVLGAPHGNRYYPDFAGVARSYNFYPAVDQAAQDGVASAALGLGRTVVEGQPCLSFSPRHPLKILSFSSVEDVLANSQRQFWALELDPEAAAEQGEEALRERRFSLATAEADGTLGALGSTYSPENHAVYDGLSRPGVRLVTFASILKYGTFPLADILTHLLGISSRGMNREVEIEFAVRLDPAGSAHEFGFLQVRPAVGATEVDPVTLDEVPDSRLICRSPRVLGNGIVTSIHDVVVVDFHRFDRSQTMVAAQEIARFNGILTAESRPYLLIGVGRWGSTDPWLGIPVRWDEIAGARVIVESGFRDIRVTPSQGSHFFQNLTSLEVGYFTVNAELGEGFVDWEWLEEQAAEAQGQFVRHLRFAAPLTVQMSGRDGRGIITRPGVRI